MLYGLAAVVVTGMPFFFAYSTRSMRPAKSHSRHGAMILMFGSNA